MFKLHARACLVVSIILLSYSTSVFGYELVSPVLKDCTSYTGFVVGNSDGQIQLLQASGEIQVLESKTLDQVIVHNVVDFPFTLDHLAANVPWYRVTLLDEDGTQFKGMPIEFVDQLAFFLNESGKIEVISFSQLSKLRDLGSEDRALHWTGQLPKLDFSTAKERCKNLPSGSVLPTRILKDPVQIEEYFRNYEQGFEKFSHLQERMNFYAKPILFPSTVRMGFIALPGGDPEIPDEPGINFKNSSSLPYGLQSRAEIFSIQSDVLPFYFPTNSINLEVKSHLFRAQLLAHVPSIAGGSSYFQNVMQPGQQFNSPSGFYFPNGSKLILAHSYNYLTDFGLDYQEWSLSFGGYYPIEYVNVEGNTREMLSSSAQPVLSGSYTKDRWRVHFAGSVYKQSQFTDGKNPSLIAFDGDGNYLNGISAATTGHYLRVGWDWDFFKSVQLQIDGIEHEWTLADSTGLKATAKEATIAAAISKEFGRYVRMKAYFTKINYDWSSDSQTISQKKSTNAIIVGGEFEFIF